MTERPHIRPPLHGERFRRYKFRKIRRAYRRIGRAAQDATTSFAAMLPLADHTPIETGELPQEDA